MMIQDCNLPKAVIAAMPEHMLSVGFRGSQAHGMYVPPSDPDAIDDIDILGVYCGSLEHYLGFGRKDVKEKWEGQYDCVFYEIRKFIGLLLNCNPNVLSHLWLKPNHIIWEHPLGLLLRENRDIFVTKKAYHSFNGYAYQQFKKMTSLNQEAQELMRGLEAKLTALDIDPDSTGESESLKRLDGTPFIGATHEQMEVVKLYRGERSRYYSGGYMGKKRRELVMRFGFDVKNAAHLIRLLRMGVEFLTDGALQVERNDRAELLSIKRGEWSLDKVKEESERLFALTKEVYVRSPLPAEPDRERGEKLCMNIVSQYHRLRSGQL
jgi:uncharacterized protein